MKKNLLALFSFSFLIRLIALNQSLWLDEAVTAKVVRTIPFFKIPVLFSPGDFHPPLYYLVLKLWTAIFGYSEIALRFPSVICSVLTGYIVYRIGCALKDRKMGFWAAALYLLNPLVVYYSQEARMYSMVTLFATCALWMFVILLKKSGKKVTPPLSLFILFSALSIWTFYGSIFFIATLIGLLFRSKKHRLGTLSLVGLGAAVLVVSPLLLRQLANSAQSVAGVMNWKSVLGPASVKNIALIFLKFAGGRISFEPKLLYYAVAGAWTIVTFGLMALGGLKQKSFLILFFAPLLIASLVSFVSPMMQYFRFLYLIPVMCLLIAPVLLHPPVLRKYPMVAYAKYAVLAGFLGFSCCYLLIPQFHREDWRTLTVVIPAKAAVYMILPSSDPVLYYDPELRPAELRTVAAVKNIQPEIYVIPYVTEVYGFDYKKALTVKGCVRVSQLSLRELVLERWRCGFLAKR